jgi:hypothetical protein
VICTQYSMSDTVVPFSRYGRSQVLFRVRDRDRILEFDGELLGESSSRNGTSLRWVEFRIYKTFGHEYVLSRVGHSSIYHALECELLQRNAIPPIALPAMDSVPCPACQPNVNNNQPFRPETPRYFARVYESPDKLVGDLYRTSPSGDRYLTRVARTVLDAACSSDPRLRIAA